MGAVGLSFGSATSGDGFDVSSTVSQIVTNLQAVETPWKNQLTSLESKDTALSSLGTQLSTLSTDLQNLTEFSGTLADKTGSSSDTSVVTGTITSSADAVPGTYTITVQNLAQTSSAASDAVGASDVLTGGITFKVGSGSWQTVNVGDDSTAATLSGLSAAINAADLGVTASVLTNADGTERLSLVSQTDGSAGQITIADSTNNPTSPTTLADSTTPDSNAGLGLATIQDGVDASFTVDGVTLTSGSNTVTGAIPGLTLQLLSTGSGTASDPESVQVVIENDTSSIESAITTFVSDYNTVLTAINAQEGTDSSGNPEPLYGSPVLAQLQEGLESALSSSFGASAINSLISLGIMASSSDDGTVSLDADTLSDALNNNFSQVVSFFQDTGSFGSTFTNTLDSLGTDSADGGVISLALSEDSSQESTLNDDISGQESLISVQQVSLTSELNSANEILQEIPEQLQEVNEMYSAITGYNSNQDE